MRKDHIRARELLRARKEHAQADTSASLEDSEETCSALAHSAPGLCSSPEGYEELPIAPLSPSSSRKSYEPEDVNPEISDVGSTEHDAESSGNQIKSMMSSLPT